MKEVIIDGVKYVPQADEINRATFFEVGKWYKNIGPNKNTDITIRDKKLMLDGKPRKCTASYGIGVEFDGIPGGLWLWNPIDFIEVPAPATQPLKCGDPVFVWDDDDDPRCPAIFLYCHHIEYNGVIVCLNNSRYGEASNVLRYKHYRPFDTALVGVSRKDWPK